MAAWQQITTNTASQTLTNKTLTSPVLNTGLSGTALLDSDVMSGVSSTTVSSSESIKAYVDAQFTAGDLDFQGDSGGALAIDLDSEVLDIAGGSDITTAGSGNTVTISVDDKFVRNDGNDTTSGTITAGGFVGDLTGSATDAGTVTTAAQGAITSLGTLTTLTVDDININGKTITMNGSSGDDAIFAVGAGGRLDITTVDAAGTDANMTLTADGNFEAIGKVITLDSGGAINLEPAGGSVILLDGTISVDAGVVTGASSITSTSFVGALTGQASTVATIAGLAPNTATTQATQASITTCANLSTVGTITTGTWDAGIIAEGKLQNQSGTNTGDQTLPTRDSLGLDTDDEPTFAGLTITGEMTATSGTVTLTGQVAIADEIVILNSDHASSAAVDGTDVGFEVERGTSANAKLLWNEKGGVTALSRWEVTMLKSDDSQYSIPLAVMGTDALKQDIARSVGDGAFYTASNALYCYL